MKFGCIVLASIKNVIFEINFTFTNFSALVSINDASLCAMF